MPGLILSSIVLSASTLFGAVPAAEPVNDVCPIKGHEVDKETPTREFRGHAIGFCCPGCDTTWDAKPESERLAFLVKYVPEAGNKQHNTPSPVGPPATPATRTARAYLDACNKSDAKALNALFLDKGRATVLENAGDEGAWETYRDHHLIPELAEMPGFTLAVASEKEQAFGSTSIVTQTGSFLVPTPNHPDAPRTFLAAVTYVIVDENGSPKIAHLHWSSRAEKKAEPGSPVHSPDAGQGQGAGGSGHDHK